MPTSRRSFQATIVGSYLSHGNIRSYLIVSYYTESTEGQQRAKHATTYSYQAFQAATP